MSKYPFSAALIVTAVVICFVHSTVSGAQARQLTLVSYSVTKEAYSKIIPLFKASWKKEHGEDINFVESYGASGSQAQAVIEGLEADVVHLAMQTDIDKIAESGLIDKDWQKKTPNDGIVARSLIIMAVRPGNPKKIKDWSDVTQKGIAVITPNPRTSGGARWNLLAAYGSSLCNGATEEQACSQVKAFYANTVVLDKNARDATNTFFKKGIGDVAALWESDALLAKAEGEKMDMIIPRSSNPAETAVSVVGSIVDHDKNRDVAEAFVKFLFSPDAQNAFAQTGLRPVDTTVSKQFASKYPVPQKSMFTTSKFGGWKVAAEKFFGKTGMYSKIEMEIALKK